MFAAEHVTYRVGHKTLLHDICLTIKPGTVSALIGPNGAGKSTLLKVLCGEITPDSGQVLIDNRNLNTYSKKELSLRRAVMPQEALVSFPFTVEEVIKMGRYPLISNKINRSDDDSAVEKSMGKTETLHLRKRSFMSLSGGEKARVTLSRILAQECPMIFLDEPTASLDPRHQHLVMSVAREVADGGGAVLAVLHDLNLVSMYADHVILLSEGRIKSDGPPNVILTRSILEDVFQTRFEILTRPGHTRPLVASLPTT